MLTVHIAVMLDGAEKSVWQQIPKSTRCNAIDSGREIFQRNAWMERVVQALVTCSVSFPRQHIQEISNWVGRPISQDKLAISLDISHYFRSQQPQEFTKVKMEWGEFLIF